nr:hypothetical protein [uncultured Flavobacterium sp.]
MKNLLLTSAVIACISLCACSSDEIEEPINNKSISATELLENEGFLRSADSLNEGDNGDVTNPRPRN